MIALPRSLGVLALLLFAVVPAYAGAVRSRQAATAYASPRCAQAGLQLTLRAGMHLPGKPSAFVRDLYLVPADMPPGSTTLSLPLDPRAQPDREAFPEAFYEVPMTAYLRSAWDQYAAPVDLAAAIAWYQKAMSACGYVQVATAPEMLASVWPMSVMLTGNQAETTP